MKKLFYIFVLSWGSVFAQNISPWDYCQDNNPIGGGSGYSSIITAGQATHTITNTDTYSTAKTLIEARSSGDIVWINNDVMLSANGFNGTSVIYVPAGVTIASDRGQSASPGGGFVRTDGRIGNFRSMLTVAGANVRITGVRFDGPMGTYDNSIPNPSSADASVGVIILGYDNVEIDNCEFYDFGNAGISVNYTTLGDPVSALYEPVIHHNYFHDNTEKWVGYGINIGRGSVIAHNNLFERNGHDITSVGQSSLSARPNIENYCNSHLGPNFKWPIDMHASGEGGDQTVALVGPGSMFMHHNDIQEDNSFDPFGSSYTNVMRIRGIPSGQVIVEDNVFTLNGPPDNIYLIAHTYQGSSNYTPTAQKNFIVRNNYYGGELPPSSGTNPVSPPPQTAYKRFYDN
jgi:hypothetical protein